MYSYVCILEFRNMGLLFAREYCTASPLGIGHTVDLGLPHIKYARGIFHIHHFTRKPKGPCTAFLCSVDYEMKVEQEIISFLRESPVWNTGLLQIVRPHLPIEWTEGARTP